MQKNLFYQKQKPKTADGLWMHKDADGNMRLDYVSNNIVNPLGYVSSEPGDGGGSSGSGTIPSAIISDDFEFSATNSYYKGDVVTRNGKLYKFTSDHSAGAWKFRDVVEIDMLSYLSNWIMDTEDMVVANTYKPFMRLNPTSALINAGDTGIDYESSYQAADGLGISENDFMRIMSDSSPMIVDYIVSSGDEWIGYRLILAANQTEDEVRYVQYVPMGTHSNVLEIQEYTYDGESETLKGYSVVLMDVSDDAPANDGPK